MRMDKCQRCGSTAIVHPEAPNRQVCPKCEDRKCTDMRHLKLNCLNNARIDGHCGVACVNCPDENDELGTNKCQRCGQFACAECVAGSVRLNRCRGCGGLVCERCRIAHRGQADCQFCGYLMCRACEKACRSCGKFACPSCLEEHACGREEALSWTAASFSPISYDEHET